jgi:hypothetical protein
MRNLFIGLTVLGICFRFYLQFFYPVFNVDEIAIGNNIKELTFLELLYPLKYNQSAPPLYLWLQKSTVSISLFDFWISIKILSFFASSLTLIYFYKLIKKHMYAKEFILIFLIVIVNPYIVYNSLTLKQYTFDALGIVMLLYYFDTEKFKKYDFIFFLVWSLISNVGLFGCVGYLIYLFFKNYGFQNIVPFIKERYKVMLSILPYLLYFSWFMQQPRAVELKKYMTIYWKESFMPLDASIFKHIFMQLHGFWVFFFTMNELIGILLFTTAIVGFIFVLKQKNRKAFYFDEVMLLLSVFLVHLVLNFFNLYPLSDRLYLYLSFLFLILLLASLKKISTIPFLQNKGWILVLVLSSITLLSYNDYILFKENDVVSLNKKLNLIPETETVLYTAKSFKTVNDFNTFTNDKFKALKKPVVFDNREVNSYYLVTRIPNKLKPGKKSKEEEEVSILKKTRKVQLWHEIKGYNIYKIESN